MTMGEVVLEISRWNSRILVHAKAWLAARRSDVVYGGWDEDCSFDIDILLLCANLVYTVFHTAWSLY
jgi:hypothetical protein